jgi:nicotinate-nucleotide adenylyltransferase
MRTIGILGGTFDPVHIGHLRTAFELLGSCGLSEVRFIPCGIPPHRPPPVAPAELRLQMLQAALAGEQRFRVDDRELRRPGPSYMVDTLDSLRSEVADASLSLLLGADAFVGLPDWHRWQDIPRLAHLIVVHRPGWQLPVTGPLAALLDERHAAGAAALRREPAGLVLAQPVTQLEVSSSAIRALVGRGGDPRFLVPDAVRAIIIQSGCYGRSSTGAAGDTEVRVRA